MDRKHSEDRARQRRAKGTRPSPFVVTVDIVLMTILRGELRIFLVQRGNRPHLGEWALPGGPVMSSEPLEEAALRIVDEEAGIPPAPGHLEQLGAYGDPARDPDMRVVTVAYWAVAPLLSPAYFDRGLAEKSTAIYAEFVPVPEIESGRLRLAFDHARIVADALDQVRSRLETTTLARRFCPPEFTISQLREVYEAVWGMRLDAANFQRKVLQSDGFVAPLEKWRRSTGRRGRPARLWVAEDAGYGRLERPFRGAWREGGG
ncbi:MAG: NUDIX domain-containing protein [Gemmatimonadota bacterium]|nr:NUDIX domain-containing protein [Gemmatimonadota bacterium]MDE2872034.1 NUDIX domain-containing protein [Gemmatimonadota bacterium]